MPHRRAAGFTLVELLATLAIGTLLLAGLASLITGSLDDIKGQQTAYYQQQVAEAAREYLRANAAELAVQAAAPATVVPVTLNKLREGRFLANSFADTNPYRQRICVLVRQPDPATYPGRFDALVVTSGGDPIGDKDLAAVAMQAGSGAGYIAATAPGDARGASWLMPTTAYRGVTCPGSPGPALQGTAADAGHLVTSVFHDGAAQQPADFLYRNAVAGRPELNTMNTPLRFAGAALVNAGDPCPTGATGSEALLAMERTTHELLSCANGTWQPSSWKAPVANYGALAALAGNRVGDVRMVTGLSRAFTYNGTGWVALAVDQNGNFDVPGTSSANVLLAREDVKSEGTMHSEGHIETKRDVNVGQDVIVKRDVKVDHAITSVGIEATSWLAAPAIEIGEVKTPGGPCNYEVVHPVDGTVIAYPFGTVVMDEARRPLICSYPDKTFRYANGQYTIN